MTQTTPNPGLPAPLPAIALPRDPAIQAALDTDHLRLLEIGFYISGVMTAFRFIWFLLMAIFFAIIGITAVSAHPNGGNGSSGGPPPALFFFIFAGVFGVIILLTLIFAGLEILPEFV
jgi:hypothetical protein